MHSIHSMIQRFRETKPTPRRERRKQRQQGQLTELWWVREESPAREDEGDDLGFTQDSLDGGVQPQCGGREKIWTSGLESRLAARNTHGPASPRLAIDKIMSEDIRRFLATGGYRSNRSPRRAALVPTSVSPTTVSRAPAKTLKTSRASYPLGRLVPTLDRGTINQDLIPAHDGERLNHTYQRESQAPDAPPSYTGKAELRGEIARASSQEEGCLERRRDMVPVMVPAQKDASGALVPSAAGVTLELDVVMDQLRNGMGQAQQAGCPDQLIPEPPQNTSLSFVRVTRRPFQPDGTLPVSLAQIGQDLDAQLLEFTLMAKAREHTADEVDKAEQVQEETTRKTDKVLEVVVSQRHGIFDDVLAAPTKPSLVGMIGSPADGNVEDRGTNGVDFDCWETVGMHGIEHSPVWGGDEDRMPPAAEDILKTERDQDLGLIIEDYPITNYGRLFRRPVEAVVALPDDCENTPAAVSQSWLYGHTTLQQTGQSIGAELEVAMLCMQKRLAKEPIILGEKNAATDKLTEDVVDNKDGKNEKGSPKDTAVGTEGSKKPEHLPQESLEVLADNMANQTLRETSELDHELGLGISEDLLGVEEGWVLPKRARDIPSGVYFDRAVSPAASGLGANAVKKGRGPPMSSGSCYPRPMTYVIPGNSPRSPHRKLQQNVKGKTESALPAKFHLEARAAAATNVPLNPSAYIAQPGDDASSRRSPPVRHAAVRGHGSSFRLPRATGSFVERNAAARDEGWLSGNPQLPADYHAAGSETYPQLQREMEYDDVDDDAGGPGFAVARARRRLRSFQMSRWSMSTPSERRYHLSKSDRRGVQRQRRGGDRKLLNRLRCMRRTYSLIASP